MFSKLRSILTLDFKSDATMVSPAVLPNLELCRQVINFRGTEATPATFHRMSLLSTHPTSHMEMKQE